MPCAGARGLPLPACSTPPSKPFAEMFTPPLRAVLLKSVVLALALIVVIGIGLQRCCRSLAESGAQLGRADRRLRAARGWTALAWVLSIMAGLGIVTGALFLMPAVTAFVGSFFVDEVADAVEREHYPAEPPGRALPSFRAVIEGIKIALLALVVYLVRAAVHAVCGPRLHHFVRRQRVSARPRIFRARRHALSSAARGEGAAQGATPATFSSPAWSSRCSCRSRSSIWRRRCSPWPSWCTSTSAVAAAHRVDRADALIVSSFGRRSMSVWPCRPSARRAGLDRLAPSAVTPISALM